MRWFMDFWKDFANSTETPHVWLGLKSKKSVRRTNALALEQTYIQSVRYADKKEPKKSYRPSSPHIHPNFKLQDDLSPRNVFLYSSINISSGIFETDKFLIRYGLCDVGFVTRRKILPLQFLVLLCGLCSCSQNSRGISKRILLWRSCCYTTNRQHWLED